MEKHPKVVSKTVFAYLWTTIYPIATADWTPQEKIWKCILISLFTLYEISSVFNCKIPPQIGMRQLEISL